MEIYTAIAAIMKYGLTATQILEALPVIMNITTSIASKGEKQLSDESMVYLQTEIEKIRRKV